MLTHCQAQALEFHTERYLPRTVTRILRRLRRAEYTEGWIIDLRCGWCEVGVIQHVGKRGLEADLHPLS